MLTDQHLLLRLIIMLVAFTGNLGSSFRQLILQSALFLLFFLFEPAAYLRLWQAFRFILSFLTAYWLIATLIGTPFPTMLLFTMRLLFFVIVSVYTFSHLTLPRVLHDTSFLLKYRWANLLIQYLLATILFIQSFKKHWSASQIEYKNDLSARFWHSLKSCNLDTEIIGQKVEAAILDEQSYALAKPASSLLGLTFLCLLIILGAV
ncbi:MAG TPA: hypothetical protein PL126_05220 [Candidatus Cloacimonadota bacterium]|nr:hypothetical protein [Candidatus Cloacimonadota bacterium]